MWRERLAEVTRLFPQDGEVEWRSVCPDQGWALYAMADSGIAALMYAIECWLTDDPQQAVWAAQRADEANNQAAMALLNIEPLKQHEKRIQSHAVVQRELARQAADLDWLARRGSWRTVSGLSARPGRQQDLPAVPSAQGLSASASPGSATIIHSKT